MSKKSRTKGFTSKGQRPNVNKKILNAVKRARTPVEKMMYKLEAALKGKKVKGMENVSLERFEMPKRKVWPKLTNVL